MSMNKNDRQALVNQRIFGNVQQLAPVAAQPRPGENVDGSMISLCVDDIDFYEDNPRTVQNEKYFDLKENIAKRGLENRLVITKRPGAARFSLKKGGNTRLAILKELWAETNEHKFGFQECIYEEYKSEVDTLLSHVIENVLRADMSYWDLASAYTKIKELFDQRRVENGIASHSTVKEFLDFLGENGITINNDAFGLMRWTISKAQRLGDAAHQLSRNIVRDTLRPIYLELEELLLESRIESADEILQAGLTAYADTLETPLDFNIKLLVKMLKETVAGRLDISLDEVEIRLRDSKKPRRAPTTPPQDHQQGNDASEHDANLDTGLSELLNKLQAEASSDSGVVQPEPSKASRQDNSLASPTPTLVQPKPLNSAPKADSDNVELANSQPLNAAEANRLPVRLDLFGEVSLQGERIKALLLTYVAEQCRKDVSQIAEMPDSWIKQLSQHDLKTALDNIEVVIKLMPKRKKLNEQKNREQFAYFVSAGASNALLSHLFPEQRSDIQQARKELGVAINGRTNRLDDKSSMAFFKSFQIYREKKGFREVLDLDLVEIRQLLIELHNEFSNWPISSIYAELMESE